MFRDLTRELRELERGIHVSVALPSDEAGYDEKECPNPECVARFKIHTDDWSSLCSDEVVYCALCRFEADSQQWFTPEQVAHAQQVASEEMLARIDRAFSRGVRVANRRAPRRGLVTFTFDYKPSRRTHTAPLAASAVLEQRSVCESCGCRYAAVGAAFFCPACGHNSAASTFSATIANVRAQLDLIPKLTELVGKDEAANLGRGMTENAMVKLVTAFQRYAEVTYETLPDPKATPGFNAFQRLVDGSDLWRGATGRGYDDIFDSTELAELGRYFQQRHCLSHNDGVVDQLYLDRSGDTAYRLGQRLVVKPAAVRRAADLIEKLAVELR